MTTWKKLVVGVIGSFMIVAAGVVLGGRPPKDERIMYAHFARLEKEARKAFPSFHRKI